MISVVVKRWPERQERRRRMEFSLVGRLLTTEVGVPQIGQRIELWGSEGIAFQAGQLISVTDIVEVLGGTQQRKVQQALYCQG